MILIDALFIADKGGGPTLLRYLLSKLSEYGATEKVFLLLDNRFTYDIEGNGFFNYISLPNSLSERYMFYSNNRGRFSRVFCFTNTPPPVSVNVPVYTYFHNQLLLHSKKQKFNKAFFPFFLRYLFVRLFNRNTDYYIVQTEHMVREMADQKLKKTSNILPIPFYDDAKYDSGKIGGENTQTSFAYVSTPSFHKNHYRLIDAWSLLNEKGYKPTLHLTVDSSVPDLLRQINDLKQKGCNIVNHGYTNPRDIYKQCKYLVYPSLNESFGLGLIEAAKFGLKVLAPDLPYVKSVLKPSLTFDPSNIASIAETVIYAMQNDLPDPEVKVRDEIGSLIKIIVGEIDHV